MVVRGLTLGEQVWRQWTCVVAAGAHHRHGSRPVGSLLLQHDATALVLVLLLVLGQGLQLRSV